METGLDEYHGVDAARFQMEIQPRYRPAVLRGLVTHWPVVKEGRTSPQALAQYLKSFDRGELTESMLGPPAIKGRFFYRDDMRGFNFERRQETLTAAIDRLLAHLGHPAPPAFYTGSVPTDVNLPDFGRDNAMDLIPRSTGARIWIGNSATISTHYDQSDNIACVVAGHRRFTLFPPEQLPNLYVGPLDYTMAGQPSSMVDLANPDFTRYPRFRAALDAAITVDLEPGDAIYIPSMWWHNVVSTGPFNVLVNYWWNDAKPWAGNPFQALVHSIMALGEMPAERREVWRDVFDHYVFHRNGDPMAHMAPEHRSITGPLTPRLAQYIRGWLLRCLGG